MELILKAAPSEFSVEELIALPIEMEFKWSSEGQSFVL